MYNAKQMQPADDSIEMIGRRKSDARKMFEESLQKVTRNHRDASSSELMHLLLTDTRPARAYDNDQAAITASSVRAPAHAVHHAKKYVISSVSSTNAHEGNNDGTSVFTSDKLDEYLANDGMQGGRSSPEALQVGNDRDDSVVAGVRVPGVDLNSSTQTPRDSVSMLSSPYLRQDETVRSVDSACGPVVETGDAQVDVIDGFCFYSFSTSSALLQHVDDSSSQPCKTAVGRTKKFQYGIAGNMSKYLARMKGWEKRTSTACDQRADALDALLSDGMVRQLSGAATLGLNLYSATGDDDDGVRSAADGGWAGFGVGRYTRRTVGKMGDEKRQPRKGRIYGRKFTGRFASKANISYHIEQRRRRSATSPYSAGRTSTSADYETISSAWQTGLFLQSEIAEQTVSSYLSPNLQPRVDLTKAIVRLKPSVARDDSQMSSKPKTYKSKPQPVAYNHSEQIHLLRLTEATTRRAIVALQLAPSMTNSPAKCNKPSMIYNSLRVQPSDCIFALFALKTISFAYAFWYELLLVTALMVRVC